MLRCGGRRLKFQSRDHIPTLDARNGPSALTPAPSPPRGATGVNERFPVCRLGSRGLNLDHGGRDVVVLRFLAGKGAYAVVQVFHNLPGCALAIDTHHVQSAVPAKRDPLRRARLDNSIGKQDHDVPRLKRDGAAGREFSLGVDPERNAGAGQRLLDNAVSVHEVTGLLARAGVGDGIAAQVQFGQQQRDEAVAFNIRYQDPIDQSQDGADVGPGLGIGSAAAPGSRP